jgi:MHS family dicarboxylic acid transporter PcaT-like MFS transporter
MTNENLTHIEEHSVALAEDMPERVSPENAAAPLPDYTPEERRKRIYSIFIASSGNLVEWFDFYVFAFCAVYFAPVFFPKSDPTAQLLNTAGIFAAGFLMRPIGGWIFGSIADRRGRKQALVTSVLMMCGGSLMIAFMPGYASIGVWAPALLLVARMIQGLSVGGEYGTTATYMSEIAMRGRRGFYSSFQYVTLIGGQLLAVLLIVLLQLVIDDAQFKAWGWRIPFVVGALSAIIAMRLRGTLRETASHTAMQNKDAGSIRALFRDHKAAFFTVVGYTAGGSLSFYTFSTYMQKYLVNTVGMPIKTASHVMTGCLFVFMCLQPVFGALSDRIGRRNNLLLYGGIGALTVIPLMTTLRYVSSPLAAFALIAFALAVVSLYTSVAGIVKAEVFPTELRALGVGLSYAVANSIFGGTAEFVALGLKTMGNESAFYVYVTVMLTISFLVTWRFLPKNPMYLARDH